jgi:hypothetical protein
MRTALFDEDEPSGIDPFGHHNPPGGTQELVALAGFHAPFLRVCFMRSISRQSLDLLTENTATFCRYALLSESLAKGRSRISAASSFFALHPVSALSRSVFGARDLTSLAIPT